MKVRNSKGELKEIVIKANDSIPAGAIVDFDGDVVPEGYEKVEDKGEVYSTEEQRIGTWIDGKPLYRKVIDTLTLPSNATVEYDITNLNIATITKLYGTASYNNGQLAKPLPFVSSGTSQIRLDVNDKKIRLITYESWSPYPSAIVIEYTKTTD